MGRKPTTRMLGCADYEAEWVDDSQMVRLTARGFLPCSNHHAQLEKRASGGWEMVLYTQETCMESYTPFAIEMMVMVEGEHAIVQVLDALGLHEITIQPRKTRAQEPDTGSYMVYARKSAVDVPDETYFILPVGTKVLPIYTRSFGPAPKAGCDAFIASENNDFMMELDELHAKIERVEGREE